jgi:hypothetical protein
MVWVAATLVLSGMIGVTASGMAQAPTPPPNKTPQHQEGMKRMVRGPHHVLAMAYRDNLATFARAMRGQVTPSKTVDLDLARPAMAEIRRSFDQMKEHHQAQMAMMGPHMAPAMSGTIQHMETHLTALGEHITALESELNGSTPDSKNVLEHTTEILKECTAMSAMPAKAKPHKMN